MAAELTNEPICPHCGYRHRDAWEWSFGAGLEGTETFECGECEKPFEYTRVVDVRYTTKKATP